MGSGSVSYSDPLSLGTWDLVRDIPPLEMNDDLELVGLYWEHLSQFAFERAKIIFDWHKEWRQQDGKMKSHLLLRLRRLYPGDWDSKYVFGQIGNNLKERRIRLRRRFEKCNNKSSVSVPMESWNAIYESLNDPKYQEKLEKCRAAAEERTNNLRLTHKLGLCGVKKLIINFVSI